MTTITAVMMMMMMMKRTQNYSIHCSYHNSPVPAVSCDGYNQRKHAGMGSFIRRKSDEKITVYHYTNCASLHIKLPIITTRPVYY